MPKTDDEGAWKCQRARLPPETVPHAYQAQRGPLHPKSHADTLNPEPHALIPEPQARKLIAYSGPE